MVEEVKEEKKVVKKKNDNRSAAARKYFLGGINLYKFVYPQVSVQRGQDLLQRVPTLLQASPGCAVSQGNCSNVEFRPMLISSHLLRL